MATLNKQGHAQGIGHGTQTSKMKSSRNNQLMKHAPHSDDQDKITSIDKIKPKKKKKEKNNESEKKKANKSSGTQKGEDSSSPPNSEDTGLFESQTRSL